jgi:5-methylcytosine-specific restriction endonuclease McrA
MDNFYKTTAWKNKRNRILRRDKYMCQECKRYGKATPATTVHHIEQLEYKPKLKLDSNNLVSLCSKCHNKMHNRDSDELTTCGLEWVRRKKNGR